MARTSTCDRRDAEIRLAHARKFLEVAELASDLSPSEESYSSIAASLAVLSGIASADAACCVALGQRSRSQEHHDSEDLVGRVEPDGKAASMALRRLLNTKDEAQYGIVHVSGTELKATIRQARQLLAFAERVFQI